MLADCSRQEPGIDTREEAADTGSTDTELQLLEGRMHNLNNSILCSVFKVSLDILLTITVLDNILLNVIRQRYEMD